MVTFDRGEYGCANQGQNDYNVITKPFQLNYIVDSIGDSTSSALQLCTSGASSCSSPGDPGTTVATAQGMISTARKGGSDRKVFRLTAAPGSLSATVTVTPPEVSYFPFPWVLSNLQFRADILDASGITVASANSAMSSASATVSYSVPAGGTYYISISPVAVSGQPSLYGSAGAFVMSATYRTQAQVVVCPTTGLPECVDPTTGEHALLRQSLQCLAAFARAWVLKRVPACPARPAAGVSSPGCTTSTLQYCAVDPGSGSQCRYSYRAATTVCRASAGPCDAPEFCTGSSASCPGDSFLGSTQVCRPATGACDQEERCTGTSAACPADSLAPPGTICRASAGACDTPEVRGMHELWCCLLMVCTAA